jgi:hypothetical protein
MQKDSENIKRDRIFDNNFESTEIDSSKASFKVDSSVREQGIDEKLDSELIEDKLKRLLEECDWAMEIISREKVATNINKRELNRIFEHLTAGVGLDASIEIFAYLQDRIEAKGEKIYDMLSNEFKQTLHKHLKERGYLKERFVGFFV